RLFPVPARRTSTVKPIQSRQEISVQCPRVLSTTSATRVMNRWCCTPFMPHPSTRRTLNIRRRKKLMRPKLQVKTPHHKPKSAVELGDIPRTKTLVFTDCGGPEN